MSAEDISRARKELSRCDPTADTATAIAHGVKGVLYVLLDIAESLRGSQTEAAIRRPKSRYPSALGRL